jgi:hypothetical protein
MSFLPLDPNQEIALRIQQPSITLHYPGVMGDEIMSNKVAWLSNSIDGPYAGKLERLTKCAFQLPNDSSSAFFIFYASLQAFITSCGFNEELLPNLQFIDETLDLAQTPLSYDMPRVGTKVAGGIAWPHFYWQEQHNRLSAAIFSLLPSKDVINKLAPKSCKALASSHFFANGFRVLQQILLMHHPRLPNTQAPGYEMVRDACPTMKQHVAPGEQIDALMGYFLDFRNWEQQITMYHESYTSRGSFYHLRFLRGLAPSLRAHLQKEEGDLQVFAQRHRPMRSEPPAPPNLHADELYERLQAIVGPLDREAKTSPYKSAHVAAISSSHDNFDSVIATVATDPETIVAMCAQIGDSLMVEEVVAAMQGNFSRRRQPQGEKRPVALCKHLSCSLYHSPDDCCICSGQRHPIDRCWHIIGLPTKKQTIAEQFKIHHQQGTGPWSVHSVITNNDATDNTPLNPVVSSIQLADKRLVTPSLTTSGVLLFEVEGDLHDVKEMDYGFTSSFVMHHLAKTPTVSAIANHATKINLPEDGPEVHFVSRLHRTDTVVTHVDTGATVMVSNVHGEIHGAIPTTSHCGTAMTGSRATIDALGTWMIDLVGSTKGIDLPLALRGTTQITEFQRRSLSLHALKEVGIDCAHVLTQKGNFLKITVDSVKHVFPLLTINGGDYVEMRVHRPPPATVAAFEVARLDLAKNFKDENLYLLLHLRYGCPGRRQMELILTSDNVKGVPANVTIPEFSVAPSATRRKPTHYQRMQSRIAPFYQLVRDLALILVSTTKPPSEDSHASSLSPNMSRATRGSFAVVPNIHQSISCYGSSSNYEFVLACHSLLFPLMEEANFGAATNSGIVYSKRFTALSSRQAHITLRPTDSPNVA